VRAWTLTLVAVATLVAGCGNWSDEDLVFMQVLPRRDAVHLRVPGEDLVRDAVAQGLSAVEQGLNGACQGGAGTLTCHTRQVAAHLNRLTFLLIDIVSAVTSRQPTQRREGVRVWGPFFVKEDGLTHRFEVRRDDAVGPGGFSYCLHSARADRSLPLADRGVACGTDASGFLEVFSGSFMPDPETGRVHTGVGEMRLDLEKQRAHGLTADRSVQGVFDFVYDNRDGRQVIGITLDRVTDGASGLPTRATYAYHREADGSGSLHLKLMLQVGCDALECADSPLETLDIRARWTRGGAGRLEVVASGGDLARSYAGWECSTEALEVVARHYDWDPSQDQGNASACPTWE
jgi:hypothetical protein